MRLFIIFLIIQSFLQDLVNAKEKFHTLSHLKPKISDESQSKTVQDLIKRILPKQADNFVAYVQSDSNNKEDDWFGISSLPDGRIQVSGSSGVGAATAFHYYLKYHCNCHISWETSQLNLPENLPKINETVKFNDKFRYYQNVCTTSYSFVWWDWSQWERHIDWMALNSFNLVLAFNGQEAIWNRVYKQLNLTEEEIDGHFSGPAFMSWLRMGNIRGWAGPLSDSWHERSLFLQKKILERMRNFGIIPVLPAFAGIVPRAFKRLYPDANMTMVETWNDFQDEYCCPYFLDPTEDLFKQIGTLFLREQIAQFGTDHVYNCDSYNENTPSSSDPTYLSNVGKSTYQAMTDVDPQAIWILQGWLFVIDSFWEDAERVRSLVTSVPLGKMIVLDFKSEQFPQYQRLDQYFGQPYIWCMLHNFGGTLGMFGSSTIINEEPIKARNAENSTMIGTGLTPEGINQNYVIYDLMTESAWRKEPANLSIWFENYATRRYGKEDQNASMAWSILQNSIYDFQGTEWIWGQYAITLTPSLTIDPWTWYPYEMLMDSWSLLLNASDNLEKNAGYRHDLVDVTRQVLQVHGDSLYSQFLDAYNINDIPTFREKSEEFFSLFPDLESILATNKAFLLGRWIESAKKCAKNSNDEKLFEYNARNQITLWGSRGEIMNYAHKQWSGVVSSFFSPRWALFVDYLNDTVSNNSPFNYSFIQERMFKDVEEPFTFDRTEVPISPKGDSVEIARRIYEIWGYLPQELAPTKREN